MDYINLLENQFLLEDFDDLFESLPDENFKYENEDVFMTKTSPTISEDSGFQGIDPSLILNEPFAVDAEIKNEQNSVLSIEREHSYSVSSIYSLDSSFKNTEYTKSSEDLEESENSVSDIKEKENQFKNNQESCYADKFSYVNELGNTIVVDKSRKNAEMAKLNRIRKKKHVSNLEAEVKSLRVRNIKLMDYKSKSDNKISALLSEVKYLQSVINNDSMISSVLKSISNNSEVKLDKTNLFKASFNTLEASRFPGKQGPPLVEKPDSFDGGICVHVSKNKVGLEFCSQCNKESNL